jgi:hypothetical protein
MANRCWSRTTRSRCSRRKWYCRGARCFRNQARRVWNGTVH